MGTGIIVKLSANKIRGRETSSFDGSLRANEGNYIPFKSIDGPLALGDSVSYDLEKGHAVRVQRQ